MTKEKKDGFRVRMGGVHTWAGLVMSALLFAIFWTGTLSVFDKEIDRWMMPATRITADELRPLSVDKDVMPILMRLGPNSSAWTINFPSERLPFLGLAYETPESRIAKRPQFHPATLEMLPSPNTRGASQFLYPFHHNLTLRQNNLGAWLVGIASMGMLCLLISGVVIHRKIFTDFFTLRIFRKFGRANLDFHNMTGVLLLPFCLMITLSGLIIAHLIYFPKVPDIVYAQQPAQRAGAVAKPASAAPPIGEAQTDGSPIEAQASALEGAGRGTQRNAQVGAADQIGANVARAPVREREGARNSPARARFIADALGKLAPPAGGQSADIVSMDKMIAISEQEWGKGTVSAIRVNNPGDIGGVAQVRRSISNQVSQRQDSNRFSLATGEPVGQFRTTPGMSVWNFIGGMHYIEFSHWLLRWLYFLGGLGGCVMIATGLVHWTQSRNKGSRGARLNVGLMNVLSIGSVTGIIAATGAFFLANRLLDNRAQFMGIPSRDIEVDVFFYVWLLCALHALVRVLWQRRDGHLRAWAEQCRVIAAIALAAVGLNWFTTGDHLFKTLFTDTYWPVAGMDLVLMFTACLAVYAARKLAAGEHHAQTGKAAQPA